MSQCEALESSLQSTVALVANLTATVRTLTSQLQTSQLQLAEAPAADPCANDASEGYSKPLHIGAVFIILMSSALGVASILLGKCSSALRAPPLLIALGKTFGTGIVLACALVHMLQPSTVSLTGPCVPTSISTDYPAYSYLFAMLAALTMQTVEMVAGDRGSSSSSSTPNTSSSSLSFSQNLELGISTPTSPKAEENREDQALLIKPTLMVNLGEPGPVQQQQQAPDAKSILSLLAAEFGFTMHSLFIGLALGVVVDTELKALLVALSFHQFFEGVSLGARLFDSSLPPSQDTALALLFTISAPLGIGCGVGLMSSGGINTNGSTFSLVQGIFDAICAGILLHIGFNLIINEFPKDVAKLRKLGGRNFGKLYACLMHVALWSGACIMAFIGKYL